MLIRKMFDRPINRDIKGVVKVGQDDDANIKQELEEYVVTNELHDHIKEFFMAYTNAMTNPTDKIGVWISGFFGSGKSHFLKILSYLIENKVVDQKQSIDYFTDKISDPETLTNLTEAGDITTDVVLFDIDAKSESDSMADKDSIVIVLNKVFNEMQGFCGSIPWIAEIERNMEQDNVYGHFKQTFNEISGSKWEDTREDFYYEEDAIVEALSKTTQMSEEAARNWFNRAEHDYSISIERFANRVKQYIDSKGDNHRVAFLIDEVGQYIGENSQAMLNLQTIVHELGRQCKGKAWIAVTSQEDIDSVLTVKGSDFSKIQGRFDTKLSLSSAFVDEVIINRILLKDDAAKETLEELYRKNNSILQNILTFSGDSAEMKNYANEAEFIDVYPFVPYQFNLLQKVFTGVRIHGASGKHLAEGERSLLSAFQESAVYFADDEIGRLVPFSAFYETIESFLDSSIRSVIIHAKSNDRLQSFDIEVLKLLFLIKYIKEVRPNIENIATLMIDHIDVEKLSLKKKISESLHRLAKETLIQKNGDEYIFLTNDEQDVNREIHNMHVDTSTVIDKIGEEIFSGIYKDRKYRYSPKYHFSFNGMIDDRPIQSQTYDIGVHILTPYADESIDYNPSELKMMSMRENTVILKLPQDTSYLDEMEEILKVEAYLRLKGGTSVSQAIEDIKVKKQREITERSERVTTYVTEALKEAEVFVQSHQMEISKKAPVDRINEALHLLIKSEYNKLDYVEKFVDSTKDLQSLISAPTQQALGDNVVNKLALDEVNHYIARLTDRNQPMTIKSIVTYFSQKPYGWLELDTTALLIELFKTQEIHFQLSNSELQLDDHQFINYVTRRNYVDRVVVKKRERISQVLLKNVRDLSMDLFEISALPTDEDGLKGRFQQLLANELEVIKGLLMNYRNKYYPGENILKDGKQTFEQLVMIQDAPTFYNKVRELRHDVRSYAVDSREVKGFFDNQQDMFDEAMKQISIFESNRSYVTDREIHEISDKMDRIVRHAEPYDMIQQLPELYYDFRNKLAQLLETECEPIKEEVERDYETIRAELEQDEDVKRIFSGTFRARFHSLIKRLQRVNNLYEANGIGIESDRLKVNCMEEIQQELNKRVSIEAGNEETPNGDEPEKKSIPKQTKTFSKNTIIRGTRSFNSEQDIERFVEELRSTLLEELGENTTINLV